MTVVDWAPKVELSETEEEWVATAELPAVDRRDLKIVVDNGFLIILGTRALPKAAQGKKPSHFSSGNFVRTFTLPAYADASKARADFSQGILKIRLPKAPKEKPRVIPVSSTD